MGANCCGKRTKESSLNIATKGKGKAGAKGATANTVGGAAAFELSHITEYLGAFFRESKFTCVYLTLHLDKESKFVVLNL